MKHNVLITGGAGFIGSHLIKFFLKKYPNYHIYNLDNLSYASNINNLDDIKNEQNYSFIEGDICDINMLNQTFNNYEISKVIHLAAESHVDRSINDPYAFVNTNVIGTVNLLQVAKNSWQENYTDKLFYHISTDEVYGSLGRVGSFNEISRYNPNSPYSASKASSDHFVRSFKETYNLPVVLSNCSNNFGSNQHVEKLIPNVISSIINKKPINIYGNGENIRDWIHVEDHVDAIDLIFHKGKLGETYNIGGSNEWSNIDLIKMIIKITDNLLERDDYNSENLINFVKDRPGHDFRYSIDSTKICEELGWRVSKNFKIKIKETITWYIENL